MVTPASPADNYALLHAALDSGDPVIYMEHKELWGMSGEVSVGSPVRLGQANIVRRGADLTIVSWSRQVHTALEAAKDLAAQGIEAEVIDLRTLWPWDRDTVLASAARTGHVLVTHESVQIAGFGAEIAATVAEHTGARVGRLGAPRIPVGYAPVLEDESRVGQAKVANAALKLLERSIQLEEIV